MAGGKIVLPRRKRVTRSPYAEYILPRASSSPVYEATKDVVAEAETFQPSQELQGDLQRDLGSTSFQAISVCNSVQECTSDETSRATCNQRHQVENKSIEHDFEAKREGNKNTKNSVAKPEIVLASQETHGDLEGDSRNILSQVNDAATEHSFSATRRGDITNGDDTLDAQENIVEETSRGFLNEKRRETMNEAMVLMMAVFGGLMIGYSGKSLGGLSSFDDFARLFYPKEYVKSSLAAEDYYCSYPNIKALLFTNIANLVGVFAKFFALWFCHVFGRKITLIISSTLILIGVGLCAVASTIPLFIGGSFIFGIGIGVASLVIPKYSYELSPTKRKFTYEVVFKISQTVGIGIANVMIWVAKRGMGWRWMLLVVLVPLLLFDRCLNVCRISPKTSIEQTRPSSFNEVFKREHRPPLIITIVGSICNGLAGSYALAFFMPSMFQNLGYTDTASFIFSWVALSIEISGVIVSIWMYKYLRRKKTVTTAYFIMLICQGTLGLLFLVYVTPHFYPPRLVSGFIIFFMCTFTIGSGIANGPRGWMGDTFPPELKWVVAIFPSSSSILLDLVLYEVFIIVQCHIKGWVYILFAGCCICILSFIRYFLPETSYLECEEMPRRVWQNHRFWGRYIVKEE